MKDKIIDFGNMPIVLEMDVVDYHKNSFISKQYFNSLKGGQGGRREDIKLSLHSPSY